MGCGASTQRNNTRKASLGNKRAASILHFAQLRDVSTLDSLYDLSSSWTLGEGGQGSVCTVTQRLTGATYAMKTSSAWESGCSLEELEKSIALQSSLDHPGIARIFDAFIDRKAERVHFTSLGTRVAGVLYRPAEQAGPRPGAVVLGSWTTVKEQMAGTYAQELARRGLVALAFDPRGHGESAGQLPAVRAFLATRGRRRPRERR